jgi:hypothetical protein
MEKRMAAPLRKSLVAALAACLVLANCGPNSATDTGPSAPAPAQSAGASAAAKPQRVGDCVETSVAAVSARLEGAPDPGSFIQYANGMSQVEYDVLPGIAASRVGDAVRVCLISVPENCPPGDDRGRVYSGTNLRTGATWSAPDSQHACGGA